VRPASFGPDDPRFQAGIDHFNRHDYFDAHEVWEELWGEPLGEASKFVQGLIQFATCLHHFQGGNLKGTRILYDGGVELLQPYGETYWRLPVRKLIADMTACLDGVLEYSVPHLPGRYDPRKESFPVKLNPALLPAIRLEASH
jgi:predicted metal-dependent hydrolase